MSGGPMKAWLRPIHTVERYDPSGNSSRPTQTSSYVAASRRRAHARHAVIGSSSVPGIGKPWRSKYIGPVTKPRSTGCPRQREVWRSQKANNAPKSGLKIAARLVDQLQVLPRLLKVRDHAPHLRVLMARELHLHPQQLRGGIPQRVDHLVRRHRASRPSTKPRRIPVAHAVTTSE